MLIWGKCTQYIPLLLEKLWFGNLLGQDVCTRMQFWITARWKFRVASLSRSRASSSFSAQESDWRENEREKGKEQARRGRQRSVEDSSCCWRNPGLILYCSSSSSTYKYRARAPSLLSPLSKEPRLQAQPPSSMYFNRSH